MVLKKIGKNRHAIGKKRWLFSIGNGAEIQPLGHCMADKALSRLGRSSCSHVLLLRKYVEASRYSLLGQCSVKAAFLCHLIHTYYHNSNLIWRTVSHGMDEVIPSDHPRREASRVIQWYCLIHET